MTKNPEKNWGTWVKMRIILLGAPGAGKGTLAKMIEKRYKIPQISTGDLFRAEIAKASVLGMKAKEYMDKGDLVPDEVTIGILRQRIKDKDCKKGFILDGFPRTIPQAEALEKITNIDYVLNFDIPEDAIVARLSARRTCSKCGAIYNLVSLRPKKETECDLCKGDLIQRPDDAPTSIKTRFKVYREKTAPLKVYYKKKKLLKNINANREVETVFTDIEEILG